MGDDRPGHDHAEPSGDSPGERDDPLADPPGTGWQSDQRPDPPGTGWQSDQRPDPGEDPPTMRQPLGDDVSDDAVTGRRRRRGRHSLRRS